MSWEKEIDELRRREELARKMGGEERIERQHSNKRYTVRERIEKLIDPGSFHEIGALAGKANYDEEGNLTDFRPSNFVLGTCRIDGRRVVLGGDDFTVRGGAADAKVGDKSGHGRGAAGGRGRAVGRLDGGGGGGWRVRRVDWGETQFVPG